MLATCIGRIVNGEACLGVSQDGVDVIVGHDDTLDTLQVHVCLEDDGSASRTRTRGRSRAVTWWARTETVEFLPQYLLSFYLSVLLTYEPMNFSLFNTSRTK